MNSASKELAVTAYTTPVGAFGRRDNNWLIWVLLIIVIFCFCGNGNPLLGNLGGHDCHKKHHHHRRDNNFFGDNGWFILIIFAVFFLFNDGVGGANTNIINVDTEDGPNC
jgi:uncharacterized membrane protein YhaH (DUF805 family)